MNPLIYPIEPLTQEAFAPFGQVIEANETVKPYLINGGNTLRYHDLANLETDEKGKLIVSIFRGQPRSLPFAVKMMERHPLGSQAFIPLSGRSYLVVVAPAGEGVIPADVRVFRGMAQQGVNYARGIWHHPLLALEAVSDFLVIDRAGPDNNCEEIFFQSWGVIADTAGAMDNAGVAN